MIRNFLLRNNLWTKPKTLSTTFKYKFSDIMEQGKRTKESTEGTHKGPQKLGGEFKITPNPPYLKQRIDIFDKLYAEQSAKLEALEKPDITITLPDGTVKKGKAFLTTPMEIAKGISQGLARACVAARVTYTNRIERPGESDVVKAMGPGEECLGEHDDVYDLTHLLEGDCTLELIKFDSEEGKEVFWHSSAHLLGCAMEQIYGIHLTHGPPLQNGFFYDFFMGNESVDPAKMKEIEKKVKKVIKSNDPFQKLVISKEQALEMFSANPFKVSFINSKIPDGARTSVYKSGSLIDLCPGPHVPSTGRIKAFKLTKSSSTNWLGDIRNDALQRVYGVSFPSKDMLKEWVTIQEEIAKRDHRIVGEQQKLYAVTKYAPGMPSFLPHGCLIYNKLTEIMRTEYKSRGFQEVNTPCMNNNSLWKTSGHYFKYQANMFFVKTHETEFGVKPMNCPGHCAIFGLHQKSYRDLPWRVADFGVLHRNEKLGALTGLTRVIKFQQDDAHIFCTGEQVYDEIMGALDFVDYIYKLFEFNYSLELSTRPDIRVGSDADWDTAEDALRKALDNFGQDYTIGEGEGAFYGPKIDIMVQDCFKRKHQLGTIQLDFTLPDRFNLQYRSKELEDCEDHLTDEQLEEKIKQIKQTDKDNQMEREDKMLIEHKETNLEGLTPDQIRELKDKEDYDVCGKLKHGFRRPYMIHRAVLGSIERCMAILTEVYGGKWPFWLSPRQVIVLPLSAKFIDYAEKVYNRMRLEGYNVEIDRSSTKIDKKVREAQLERFNYMLVVGGKEEEAGTVNVRIRDEKKPLGVRTVEEVLDLFKSLEPKPSKATNSLREAAFFRESSELDVLEAEIQTKVYFEGEGLAFGARDQEVLEQLKEIKLDAAEYPQLTRWLTFVKKTQPQRPKEE